MTSIDPVKILYHHRTASKDGQAVHIEELIASFRTLGHEVRVVAPSEADEGMGSEVGWVQRLRRLLPRWIYELLELGYSMVAYRRLSSAAAEFKPDFIYERYNLFLLAGVMLKRQTGLPLLLEVNAPLAEERGRFGGLGMPWLARWAEGVVWRGADYVLPVSCVLAEHVAARRVPAEHILVIPNGINKAHFALAPTPSSAKAALGWDDALVLGFTGFVRQWHGVDRVLRWMASAAAPSNAKFLLVGDGPAREELETLATALGLADRVRFTGVVSRSDVPTYMAAFDIALQPAVVPYASPLKLFEYLALGKAIVAPRQPNIEEVLRDERNALLFDPAQPTGLETALTRLCVDTDLRARISAGAAASIATQQLTWNSNARRVLHLVRRGMLAEAGTPDTLHTDLR